MDLIIFIFYFFGLIFKFHFANNQPAVENKEMQLKQPSNTFKLSEKENLKFGGSDFYSDTLVGDVLDLFLRAPENTNYVYLIPLVF